MAAGNPSAPRADLAVWDSSVRESTNDFMVEGDAILIKFTKDGREKLFKVSRALLSHWSPTFRTMFEDARGDVVELHNDAEEFTDFLWFIHVDPLSFLEYTKGCPSPERFRRALGIASIAHFCEATTIAKWAIQELLDHLQAGSTPDFLPRLHRLAGLCADLNNNLAPTVRTSWCTMISSSSDPIAALLAAKKVEDHYLQAYAYYHILKKTTGEIADDSRLDTLDRLRIMTGSFNLRRYEASVCTCIVQQVYNGYSGYTSTHTHVPAQTTTKEYEWSPKAVAPLQDVYDNHTLWDLFTRSPLGINLSDGIDVSQLALPARVK